MTDMIGKTAHIQEMNKLKAELILESVQCLLTLKSNHFELSTEKKIEYAVNCTLKNLLQQKIQNGAIQVIKQDNSGGVMQ